MRKFSTVGLIELEEKKEKNINEIEENNLKFAALVIDRFCPQF